MPEFGLPHTPRSSAASFQEFELPSCLSLRTYHCKSEIDDTHVVMDFERGVQKVRTVRRMPVEFRWNAEMLQDIRFTPWKPTQVKSAQVVG